LPLEEGLDLIGESRRKDYLQESLWHAP
jgi:hypothetical protein